MSVLQLTFRTSLLQKWMAFKQYVDALQKNLSSAFKMQKDVYISMKTFVDPIIKYVQCGSWLQQHVLYCEVVGLLQRRVPYRLYLDTGQSILRSSQIVDGYEAQASSVLESSKIKVLNRCATAEGNVFCFCNGPCCLMMGIYIAYHKYCPMK